MPPPKPLSTSSALGMSSQPSSSQPTLTLESWGTAATTKESTKQSTKQLPKPKVKRKAAAITVSSNPSPPHSSLLSPPLSQWIDSHKPTLSTIAVHKKKVQDVTTWLLDALTPPSLSYTPRLLTLLGGAGVGKSTLISCICADNHVRIVEWRDGFEDVPFDPKSFTADEALRLDRKTQLDEFEEFLQTATTGRSLLASSSSASSSPSIVVLDALPYLHGDSQKSKFHTILAAAVSQTRVPIVLLHTDISESGANANPYDLELLIGKDLVNSVHMTQLRCNLVAKTAMVKALKGILAKEGIKVKGESALLDFIYEESGGDIRSAIMALQFRLSHEKSATITSSERMNSRDLQMSGLHALGKLLYAKRLPPTPDDPRGPLSFSPERVVDTNDMHCSSILAFTVHHSPSFFTDCEELSDAYRSFSDADVFVSKIFSQDRDRGETVYPGAYATSLVGRTVAAFNSHPAPRTFHPLTKPPLYENSRKMGENKVTMEGLQARVSEGEISRGGFGEFVTDMLPYLRQIHPTDASLSLSLHSHVRKEQRGSVGKQDSRVLADDDIMDDDSDGW